MSERKRYFTNNKNATVLPVEASRLIAEQTAAFLKHGGAIQRIPNGVSGQKNLLAPQQIGVAKDVAESPAHRPQPAR